MRCPDVNILLYAHRRDQRHHGFYRAWIESLANGREPFALSGWGGTWTPRLEFVNLPNAVRTR